VLEKRDGIAMTCQEKVKLMILLCGICAALLLPDESEQQTMSHGALPLPPGVRVLDLGALTG
jgi:hypothetical protein